MRTRIIPLPKLNKTGVKIVIADTGKGIAKEDRSRIFDAFFTTKKNVGTGLGLWLTRSIVEKYGGDIRVRSCVDRRRSGTVFLISWPFEAAVESGRGDEN